jgi:hypothetical protein
MTWMHLLWVWGLTLAATNTFHQAVAQPLPNFGVMYNNDGDISYPSPDPAIATQILNDQFGAFADTPVKTVMYGIGSGSDILHYPTQVANNFGWRTTSVDNTPAWSQRVNNGKIYAQVGFDPIRVVGEKVKSMGKYFVPSYRMNDDHFVTNPMDYPLTGEFWINNQDKTIGSSPVAGYDYSNLLNYAYEEVRDFRMAVIDESIDRYSDIMDGYELDFNRVQIFFAPGTAQTNAHYMTEVVQHVRNRLNEVETETGRQQYLFVRVPPALENNTWSGLEVENWMENNLVDVVIPSVLQTLSHDVPITDFLPTAHDNGVQVAPSIYPRTNYGWDFQPNPNATTYSGPANARVASAALVRGAVGAYRHLGADGFQMYNYGLPEPESWQEFWEATAEAMDSESPTAGKDRIYAITPGYFNDNEDNYEYAKQLPFSVPSQASQLFTMVVGDDPVAVAAENPRAVELRLGLTNTAASAPLTITINGHQIHSGALTDGYFALNAPATQDGPQAYFHLPITDLSMLEQGINNIQITNNSSPNVIRITDIQLGIFAVQGINNPRNSSIFPFKYEGDAPTIAGANASNFGNTGYSGSIAGYQMNSSGGILTVTGNGNPSSVVYLQSPTWTSQATNESGWTWEARLQMTSGRFTLRIGDNEDPHDIIDIFDDGRVSSRTKGLISTLPSTTDGMHTYRIAQAPGSDEYNIWVDGELIGLFNATDTGIGVGGSHWWSDGGSTSGNYLLDYIRFSPDGFSPFDPPSPSGDFDEDGDVDGRDFLIWQRGAGSSGMPGMMLNQGDANSDGTVNSQDLEIWHQQFGSVESSSALTQVPEPSGRVALLSLGGLLLVTNRRTVLLCPRVSLVTILVLAFTLSAVGCKPKDGLQRVLVTGKVTFQDQPVEAGQIRFNPISGTRGPITIAQIVAGEYTTDVTNGVPAGQHQVKITGYDGEEYEAKRNRGPGSEPPKQLLPEKYNENTELTLEVVAGSDSMVKDFSLQP